MVVISLFIVLLFSIAIFNNYSISKNNDINNKATDILFLKNADAVEEGENSKDGGDKNEENKATNIKNPKSIFNIVAVGDWDCTGETEDTVDNILD